ncbi:MAG: hypothetical protein ABR536_00955, partial [Solirubrobacterales bacterium]
MRTRLRFIPPGFLAVALLALALAAPASASHSQLTFFDASNEQDGTRGGPALVHSLDELKALGVDVVRLQVSWR